MHHLTQLVVVKLRTEDARPVATMPHAHSRHIGTGGHLAVA